MKDISLLVWLTQLGLSVAVPLAGFILLAVWLRDTFGWGNWVLFVGIGVGIVTALNGLLSSIKAMEQLSRRKKEDTPPPVSFNDHE